MIDKFDINIIKRRLHNLHKQKYKKIDWMQGNIKIFDKALYEKYDKEPRKILKEKLNILDKICVIDNPNKYNEDLIIVDEMLPYKFIEIQVYGKWLDKFPYPQPYVYERKLRYDMSTLFICFNATYDKVILFSKDVVENKKQSAENYSNEFIYNINWNNAEILNLDNLNINYIIKYYKKLKI